MLLALHLSLSTVRKNTSSSDSTSSHFMLTCVSHDRRVMRASRNLLLSSDFSSITAGERTLIKKKSSLCGPAVYITCTRLPPRAGWRNCHLCHLFHFQQKHTVYLKMEVLKGGIGAHERTLQTEPVQSFLLTYTVCQTCPVHTDESVYQWLIPVH